MSRKQQRLKKKGLTVALAAGGTGGHFFPAKALALLLKEKGHTPIFFTDNRAARYVQSENIPSVIIASSTITKRTVLSGVWKITAGVFKSTYHLRRNGVDMIVGFGGYPSFPVMYSSVRRRRKKVSFKTIIHEQNSYMGVINRFLVDKVDAIATSFERVAGYDKAYNDKVVLTGNPVRPEIIALYNREYKPPEPNGTFHILVLGGSQGATVFSDIVPDAIGRLPPLLQQRICITQQCRQADLEKVRAAYESMGVRADLAPFFKNMAELYEQSHLVICRSGASTVSELAVAGVPSILVPYPHAKEDHQFLNAKALSDKGGTWIMKQVDFTGAALAHNIQYLDSHPEMLTQAATRVKLAAHPDAAQKLLELVEKIGQKK